MFLPSLLLPQRDYRTAADHLQESLAADPRQKPLFTILETVMSENIKLYDDIAFILDKVGLSAEAHEYRELVKDRRYFAETLTAALESLREKSIEEKALLLLQRGERRDALNLIERLDSPVACPSLTLLTTDHRPLTTIYLRRPAKTSANRSSAMPPKRCAMRSNASRRWSHWPHRATCSSQSHR